MILATTIAALALLYLFVGLGLLARRKAHYSHRRHTISEIREKGAPDQHLVVWGLFLPVSLLLIVVAYLLRLASIPAAVLALSIAVGYLGAAIFPRDPGSPLAGSLRQSLHNLSGAVE